MLKKEEYKKLFREIIRIINKKGFYGDVLLIDSSNLSINRDFTTVDISNTGEKGVKIRVFDEKSWFETFATDLSKSNLIKITQNLVKNLEPRKGIKFDDEPIEKSFADRPKINPKKIPITEKIAVVERTISYLKKQKHLKNARVVYEEDSEFKIFCSKNRYLTQKISMVSITCFAIVQDKKGQTRYRYQVCFEPGFEATKNSLKVARMAADESKKLIYAKKLKPGKYHCILDPEVTGLLAHESFGHGMESDTVYKDRALAKQWKGKRIAADFVNIIDDPSFPNKHGSYYFDDEGQIAKPTYLVKNGVVNDYITEMLTAKKLGVKRTANGRCESFDHKIYARMSNTFFAEGDSDIKDMFKKIKDGIYLMRGGGGMEDPKGWGVQIQGLFARRIKNGKLVDEYYDDVGITGYLPEILGNIKQVSKQFDIKDTGHCGKGHKEWVRVSTGGSYLRIDNLNLA